MKGLLITGKDGEARRKLKLLEAQLKETLGAREYQPEDEEIFVSGDDLPLLKFRKGTKERRLAAEQIVYLEKQRRKIIAVREEAPEVTFYSGMQEVVDQLDDSFVQCHKSFVVNMEKVAALEEEGFRMTDGSLVPVAQRRRSDVAWTYEEFKEQKNLEKLRFSKSFSCFEI